MAGLIRLFIAVPVSRALLEPASDRLKLDVDASLSDILAQLRRFGRSVNVVTSQTMHVTLKFVGDVDRDLVPQITGVVEDVAATESDFEMPVTGIGAFPNATRPAVVWAGLSNSDACVRMKAVLEDRLIDFGIEPEDRPFRPHLTLARVKDRPPQELFRMLAEEQTTRFGTEHVRAIELVQSELKPGGPKYTTLTSVRLSG